MLLSTGDADPALPNLEIELRQDLLADDIGVALWAGRIVGVLAGARITLNQSPPPSLAE